MSITIQWEPPPENTWNGNIRLYTVSVLELDTGLGFERNSSDTQLFIGNLHPYYNYSFSLAAFTVGPGPFTDQIFIQTYEDGMP